jgi:hypothetical protein
MYGLVTIGDKKVPMLANAATPFRFKMLFQIDLLQTMMKGDDGDVTDYEKLAFVMAMQAEKKDLSKLSEEDFFLWLEEFEFTDLVNALPEVVNIYMKNTKSDSDPK